MSKIDSGIHDDVQSAGRLCFLCQLDRHTFAGILFAAATAMKPVIIGCPEVKPQSILVCQEFSQRDVCQGQVFLQCLVPHLIGTHSLTEELVWDPLDGDLTLGYFRVIEGLGVRSEGQHPQRASTPFMLRAGTLRLNIQRVPQKHARTQRKPSQKTLNPSS